MSRRIRKGHNTTGESSVLFTPMEGTSLGEESRAAQIKDKLNAVLLDTELDFTKRLKFDNRVETKVDYDYVISEYSHEIQGGFIEFRVYGKLVSADITNNEYYFVIEYEEAHGKKAYLLIRRNGKVSLFASTDPNTLMDHDILAPLNEVLAQIGAKLKLEYVNYDGLDLLIRLSWKVKD